MAARPVGRFFSLRRRLGVSRAALSGVEVVAVGFVVALVVWFVS